MKCVNWRTAVTISTAACCCRFAGAQPFPHRVIADNSTVMPGSSIMFGQGQTGGNYFSGASIGDGRISFWGSGREAAGLRVGIFESAGGVVGRIADTSVFVPGTMNPFTKFDMVSSAAASGVAFAGQSGSLATNGLFYSNAGVLKAAATTNTPIPGGSGNFGDFIGITKRTSSEGVLFNGRGGGGQQGIYLHDGSSLSRRVDLNNTIPGGSGTFTSIDAPTPLRGGSFFFGAEGSNGQAGLYMSGPTSSLSVIHGSQTPVPGQPGKFFTAFGAIAEDAAGVVFVGRYGPGLADGAIYSSNGTTISHLIGAGDPVPGGGILAGTLHVAASDGRVAFSGLAVGAADSSVYVRQPDGTVSLLAGPGSVIDGKTVDAIRITSQALEGNTLVAYINFIGPDEGIYAFTVPAPGAVGLLGLAGLAAARRRRA